MRSLDRVLLVTRDSVCRSLVILLCRTFVVVLVLVPCKATVLTLMLACRVILFVLCMTGRNPLMK